jgi:integrase/recombinase XerD
VNNDRRGLVPIQKAKPGALTVSQPAVEAGKAFLSKNTIRAYTRDWLDFFKVERLDQVTVPMAMGVKPDQVADFRDECLAKGLGPGTVNRKLSSVRAFFDQLILRGLISINPAHPKLVRSPKRGTVQKMEALSVAEAQAFLGTIDRSTVIGRRDYAVIMMDLHMGLRRSEALSVKADQFRTIEGKACIVFRSKGERERIIWVNRDLEEALASYAKDRGTAPGWLFTGRDPKRPLSGDQFWRIVQAYLEKAGIKKKVGTHGLRATFISVNFAKGTPIDQIQKSVGHSRGETTLGYARDLEMVKSRAPAAMEGMNGNGPEKGS